ncbi:peptide MFS transporter [Corynebacterium freiburgense]|uniref:peptide MFS transporter n=1 Tax=Corynebacterium freiburgense TaxID=556548 RepID=UPI0003F8CE54|nr:oligopeptide:H+ symporter [Corynebacterium freiburgense]WJZ02552.1 Di-/tripeptide transporter [Corynebacterium freiburgense]
MTLVKRSSSDIDEHSPTPSNVTPGIVPAMVGVEMWERFSFYGMQAILVYYLYSATTGLGLDKTTATALMGTYGASVYLCTIAGGWVADRLFGPERTLLGGAITLVVGHLALSLIPGGWGAAIGLCLIAIGSGFLKTAAITVLGEAFAPDAEAQRDAAFQVFYMGINIGALLGPILTGWLSQVYGFHIGFGAAALLMIIALCYYLVFRKKFLEPEMLKPRNPLTSNMPFIIGTIVLLILCVIAVLITNGSLALSTLSTILLVTTITFALALFVQMFTSKTVSSKEKRQVVAYIPLFIASCAFWSILNQTYGVFAVYSDIRLDRTIGSFTIPASWTQSLNPLFILVFSIPLALLWTKLPKFNSPAKMGIGVIISGSGLLVLLPFAGSGEGATPFLVLAAATFVITLGELFVGPVGMSATTKYAPRAFATRFSALYFLSLAIGTAAAGVLSTFYNPNDATQETWYFLGCSITVMTIGLVVFLFNRKTHN